MDEFKKNSLDLTTLIGIFITLIMIYTAISLKGNIIAFIDISSIMIVIFGTFAITTACFSFKDVLISHKYIIKMLLFRSYTPSYIAKQAIEMAVHARSKGVRSLEKLVKDRQYSKSIIQGIEMIVDNIPSNEIEQIFTQEIASDAERGAKLVSILRKSAEIAPAMGLIGTLIGLVKMLGSLSDISKIGPAMALALLTTFYGAILSYVIFFPLASKLESNSKEVMLIARIYLCSLISISKEENPRNLEKQINSMLSPAEQVYYFKS